MLLWTWAGPGPTDDEELQYSSVIVDVVTAVEGTYYLPGVLALINSTLANAWKTAVRFHVLVPQEVADDGNLQALLLDLYPQHYQHPSSFIRVVGFDTKYALERITVYKGEVLFCSALVLTQEREL